MPQSQGQQELDFWSEPTPGSQTEEAKATLQDSGSHDFFLDGEEPPESAFASKHPLNILFVDDIEVNRRAIKSILENFGYACAEATNGQEAVEACRKMPIDCIFMDLDMPVMSGLEATRIIRKEEALKPDSERKEIIALSANISPDIRLRCRAAGMNGFLEKPATEPVIKKQLISSWRKTKARRAKQQA